MKTILTAIPALLLASTAMASNFAQPVPEISALEGGAAIAAVVASLLFLWERRRKA